MFKSNTCKWCTELHVAKLEIWLGNCIASQLKLWDPRLWPCCQKWAKVRNTNIVLFLTNIQGWNVAWDALAATVFSQVEWASILVLGYIFAGKRMHCDDNEKVSQIHNTTQQFQWLWNKLQWINNGKAHQKLQADGTTALGNYDPGTWSAQPGTSLAHWNISGWPLCMHVSSYHAPLAPSETPTNPPPGVVHQEHAWIIASAYYTQNLWGCSKNLIA